MNNVLPFKKKAVIEVAGSVSEVNRLQSELDRINKVLSNAVNSHEREIKVHKRHAERQDEIIRTYAHMLIEVALGKKQGETAEQALSRLVNKTYAYLLENGTYKTPEESKAA